MTRRALRVLAALGGFGLVLALAVPLGRPGVLGPSATVNGRAAFEMRGEGPLRAGAGRARIAIDRPGGLFARALAFSAGGATAVVVALDALLVPGPLEEEVLRETRLPPRTCLILAATHTHAGAGGTWNNLLAEVAGNGVYQADRMRAHRDAAAQAIAQALAALAPAKLAVVQAPWAGGPARPRGKGPIDPTFTALRLSREDGTAIGTLVGYGMHPTVLRRDRAFVSGDWPGEAARILEDATGAPALVVQGAGGNATWAREGMPASPQAAVEALGSEVAAHAQALLAAPAGPHAAEDGSSAGAPSRDGPSISCAVRLVALPKAEASARVPRLLRTLAGNLLALVAPHSAVQTRIDLPGLTLFGVPAEVVGDYGLAAHFEGQRTALVTLADGYAGYVETPERAAAGSGEAMTTYYGEGLARALLLPPARGPGGEVR
ncbi:MAG TPA: neutral/alkaline non-lysosomal ceramidase N-terminal domain-containing protein [Myxococcales bacterium]|nr:neutral/alkaline non-lysosomal ceramidase N-terminal domain-containing protein [Myxococcales bacterium]